MSKTRLSKLLMVFLLIIASAALLLAIYSLPPVHERLYWRVSILRSEIYYFFNPPGATAFSPGQQAEMEEIIQITATATVLEPTATLEPTVTPTNFVSPTPTQTATPTPSPTPLPNNAELDSVSYESQSFNNCGPANLSMALSYWGWDGSQVKTAAWLRPNLRDRNVMPYEMVSFVKQETDLHAILRHGGDLEMIKSFIAAEFPVLIERGYELEATRHGWMGHYGVVTAYDDNTQTFTVLDSYYEPNSVITYQKLERQWQAFNYLYIIIYPPERESEVFSILGPHADETYNYQYAAEKAQQEITDMQGRNLFFAWFNYGTSLVNLLDYYGAAQAYDRAFQIQEEGFEELNPWRMMWYQTGPYFAYFYTGRYQDVINLANYTFDQSDEPAIEESWVWRGRARLALGDQAGAIADFREALRWHPGWWVAEDELRRLGVEP
jgi:hypothetical protein